MSPNNQPPASAVSCSLLVKTIAEDDHIYHFDDSWNLSVGGFQFTRRGDDRIKVQFSFQAQLRHIDEEGHSVTVMGDEGMDEMQPFLEKIESLLDIFTLYTGIPLAIEDGSFVISGAGMSTSSAPVVNTLTLHDVSGLQGRYSNLLADEDLANAARFFRLSLIDKEYTGKGIKFWAALEALYNGEKEKVPTVLSQIIPEEQAKIEELISTLKLDEDLKERLRGAIKYQKTVSDKDVLSQKIRIMNESGDISSDDVREFLRWWSGPRNLSAHGKRIRRDDEDRKEAVDDLKDTIEMLLQSEISPSMHAYFIGHPKDIDSGFWDENDHSVNKISESCWVKPIHWGTYLLEHIGHHKIGTNGPLVYVNHDKMIEVTREGRTELEDISHLPGEYQTAIKKVQAQLNKNI